MIGYLKARSAERKARRSYELVILEGLIAENRRQMEKRAESKVCLLCADVETAAQRDVCASA